MNPSMRIRLGFAAGCLILTAACGEGAEAVGERPATTGVAERSEAGAAVPGSSSGDRSADLRDRVEAARQSEGALRALGPGSTWLDRYAGLDLDELYAAVSTGIRYEPYAGVLRGATGTAVAGAGNAWDQSVLLLELLRGAGYRARLARGTLEGSNLEILLRGIYPPELPEIESPAGLALYEPAADGRLRTLATDHVWVEVDQGGSWLPLDPSFPRGVPGEAYAKADLRVEEPPEDRYQRLRLTVRQERANGRTETLGEIERRVADLAYRPISFLGREAMILESPEPGPTGGGPAGMLGGLAGGLGGRSAEPAAAEPAASEPVPVGYRLERRLEIGEETLELAPADIRDGDRRSGVRREWLELELSVPGARPHRLERVLFEAGGRNDRPTAHRRYTLTVVPGPTPKEALAEQRERVRDALPLEDWSRELEAIATSDPAEEDVLARLDVWERASGMAAAHLANLAFAAESDAIAGRIARANAVRAVQATPRLLLMSVETAEAEDGAITEASLDLRLDEVDAIPFAGAPDGVAVLFRTARGLQNAVLEGAVLARLVEGAAPLTAAGVIARAHEEGIPVHVATPENRAGLDAVRGLSEADHRRLETSLASGRHVLVPVAAVRVAGRDRWAWWELDPETGHVIGVLEGGGHQATVEYKLTTKGVGIRDDMAFAIGAMTGATTTQILIAAKILEYGGVTPELVAEVARWLEGFSCLACPKAEVGVSAEVQLKVSGGCLEKELFKREAGLSAGVNFCGKYNDGFDCASGMILAGLAAAVGEKGDDPAVRGSYKAQLSGEAVVGCHKQSDTYGPSGTTSETRHGEPAVVSAAPDPVRCGWSG